MVSRQELLLSFKSDTKSVFRELSPILAGFKLALIVISYFGLGSVAKWVISYWYPFTRRVWDTVCDYITLPHLPVVLKDSLTAFVFFLPLGLTALWQIKYPPTTESRTLHRVLGGFFGVIFLVLICKDVLSSIAQSISEFKLDGSSFTEKLLERALDQNGGLIDILESRLILIVFAIYVGAFVVGILGLRLHYGKSGFRRLSEKIAKASKRLFRYVALVNGIASGALAAALTFSGALGLFERNWAVLLSIVILLAILSLVAAAVAFAPRKLFLTTGAAMAFVLAALIFEAAVTAIRYIESTSTI